MEESPLSSKVLDKYLTNIYYDTAHPASFSGPYKIYNEIKKEGKYDITLAQVKKWLSYQDPYTVFRAARRVFPRKRIISRDINYLHEMDVIDWVKLKDFNRGFSYILAIVDTFSKRLWTRKMKTKSGKEIADALESIFSEGNIPQKIRSDQAAEFRGLIVQKKLLDYGVTFYYTQNTETKASIIERTIKTIRMKLIRNMDYNDNYVWVDYLENVTKSYNNSYHSSIGMSPLQVNDKNKGEIWEKMYAVPKDKIQHIKSKKAIKRMKYRALHKYKFRIGDKVRISIIKKKFHREYSQKFTIEIFQIVQRFYTYNIETYKLKDDMGELLEGTYYAQELQLVRALDSKQWRIDKIIQDRYVKVGKKRVKQSLVSWRGHGPKFNTWIDSKEIVDLGGPKQNIVQD